MDVRSIVSDAGSYGTLNKVRNTDSAPKVEEKAPETELETGEVKSSADLVVQIIQDADESAGTRDGLETESQSKGRYLDVKV